jgi:hypothetical protein
MTSSHEASWSDDMEEAYQKFKRHFEDYRALAGQEALRINRKAFRVVNEHHAPMLPILNRLERELVGPKNN